MNRRTKCFDWLLIILINFMWATQAPVIRWMGEGVSPIAVAFIPMLASTLLFLPVMAIQNKRSGRGLFLKWTDAKHFVTAGLLGLFLLQFAYTVGAQRTLAANAGVITLTVPVFAVAAASCMLGERLNRVRVLSFVVALSGVLLTCMQDLSNANLLHGKYLAGNLIFLVACACSGFYNSYCKLLVDKGYTELEVLVFTSLVGSFAALPLLIWVDPVNVTAILSAPGPLFWGLLELSLIVYGLSMLLFFYILKRMDVTQAVMGNYLLPFFIAVLAVALLKEPLTPPMLIGAATILASTLALTVYEEELLRLLGKRDDKKASTAVEI